MTDDAKEEPQEELDLNFHTDMPVGEILRRTRMHYGQSLFQIEGVLRIRASQLEALEKGEIHKLPGRVYAIGFVRSYSEYLGLDGDKMVHLFKEQSVGRQKKPDLSFPVPASESKVPNFAVIGGSVFGVLVLIGFVSFLMFPERQKNDIPAVPDVLTTSQLNEAPSLVEQAPAQVQPQAAAPVAGDGTAGTAAPAVSDTADNVTAPSNRVILEITDSSWVEIKNADGAAILRQVLKPGDVYLVPDEPGLQLATGNAGGIRVKVDGQALVPLGETGQIKRKVALDADTLKSQLPAAPAVLPPVAPAMIPASPTAVN